MKKKFSLCGNVFQLKTWNCEGRIITVCRSLFRTSRWFFLEHPIKTTQCYTGDTPSFFDRDFVYGDFSNPGAFCNPHQHRTRLTLTAGRLTGWTGFMELITIQNVVFFRYHLERQNIMGSFILWAAFALIFLRPLRRSDRISKKKPIQSWTKHIFLTSLMESKKARLRGPFVRNWRGHLKIPLLSFLQSDYRIREPSFSGALLRQSRRNRQE